MKGAGEQARQTAERLKTKGNECFHKVTDARASLLPSSEEARYPGKNKIGAAIDLYTEAFTLCPHWPVPLVNRALCHKKNEDWNKVIEDCEKVIQLDTDNLKAHFFLGLAQTNTNRPHLAVQNLSTALKLARNTESTIKEEVWRTLARAKFESHSRTAAERAVRRGELLQRLKSLLKEDVSRRIKDSDSSLPDILEQQEELERDTSLLEDVFKSDELKYQGEDVPNWCTCQLTLEVFHEPVVTPCGISYENQVLLEHLRKVGEFDPVTRRPMKAKDVRKNIGLRNAVESYLDDNPWAWYYAM